MLRILALALLMNLPGGIAWHYDLGEAQQIAKKDHRHILLSFSGSDWCGPCIRMRKEIFEQQVFLQMADTQLVMVNADFPQMKKHQLAPHQQELNNAMAEKYNAQGKFPLTLLLTAEGRVLASWDGYPDMSPSEFAAEVKRAIEKDR